MPPDGDEAEEQHHQRNAERLFGEQAHVDERVRETPLPPHEDERDEYPEPHGDGCLGRGPVLREPLDAVNDRQHGGE